ncbi:hypothetical protein DUI87_31193 [Hirundo rustica rustica]|uniref:RING-type E3 ubiquitin transferase n=1 Tax=Hirundo rustica rustica TaxID=333673 RepID=A0A3M0IVA9_HIRRU|nr:hypothetical protein DUI87_31193 [Hirundo rustica rustica]
MRTNHCSHLPGIPPECPRPPAPDGDGKSLPSSSGDLATSCPQYVMQVSSKDGQLLSSVVRTLAVQSSPFNDRPICRICHEGSSHEELLSPCECTGTLGTIHRSCLEHWLSSSNTSYCELCHFRFAVERKPRPLLEVNKRTQDRLLGGESGDEQFKTTKIALSKIGTCILCLSLKISSFFLRIPPQKWLRSPGPQHEKRTLFGDIVCFLFITPLATVSGWLCLRGAMDHLHFSSRLEAVGLIALTVALFTIYLFWTLVSFRYHCRLYHEWRRNNQRVMLLIPKSANVPSTQQSLLGLQPLKRSSKETIV